MGADDSPIRGAINPQDKKRKVKKELK